MAHNAGGAAHWRSHWDSAEHQPAVCSSASGASSRGRRERFHFFVVKLDSGRLRPGCELGDRKRLARRDGRRRQLRTSAPHRLDLDLINYEAFSAPPLRRIRVSCECQGFLVSRLQSSYSIWFLASMFTRIFRRIEVSSKKKNIK